MAALLGILVALGAALPLLLFSCTEAGEVGVNYGRVANDLPDPAAVVNLLKQNGVTMVRLYDANAKVLRSLANTGIKVMVMLPNENLTAAASDSSSFALRWVQTMVASQYPATRIHGVAVGNEVFDSAPDLTPQLVPAMTNVQAALAKLGLADAIKVSTPVAFSALADSWPPSEGSFRDDIAESVMKPMLDLLQRTGSYLTVNLFPFFTYTDTSDQIPLDYALGNSNPGVPDYTFLVLDDDDDDDDTSLVYYSLLDAQLDATFHAMEGLGFPSLRVVTTETGWPSGGKITKKGGRKKPPHGRLPDSDYEVASVANAQAYNTNLINRILAGRTGTPYRPDADMDVYILELFNAVDQKGEGAPDEDDVERNFGLFYPGSMRKVYAFELRGGGGPPGPATPSWCVANAAAGERKLQRATDYACRDGADCGAIRPGGACFQPDTTLAHATYAFNSYYQRKGRAVGTCNAAAGFIVYKEPAAACQAAATANAVRGGGERGGQRWCVANAAAGDARLQAALDYACGHGADCSDIQPGAACHDPNTMAAHASHAFNSYYQRNHRANGSCYFAGAATVVYQAPKIGNCMLPARA